MPVRSRFGWLSTLALLVAAAAAAALLLSGPGYRQQWWPLATAFTLLRWAAYGGVAAVVLGLLGLLLNRPRAHGRAFVLGGAAVLAGLLVAGIPWQWQRTAAAVPRIHDISTDLVTPPTYDEVARVRAAAHAPNSLDPSDEVAAQQRLGYPDLGPLFLDLPPDAAYDRALALVRARGWDVVQTDPGGRRIEATDTTFWFGFKDDVVIRVLPTDTGSRVDMRSVSRVGRSDVGTNARRIREFFGELRP